MNLTKEEEKLFRSLNSPKKIQDFVDTLGKKIENKNEFIIRSPRLVLKTRTASCIEGALLAYAISLFQGNSPSLFDLKVGKNNNRDVDHVVTLFISDGYFGAISKTRHAVLRYREPVYKSVRELAMSYFHEYFTDDGQKTLRSFSAPFKIQGSEWITSDKDLYEIAVALDESPHTKILSKKMERGLRLADKIEIKAGKLIE